ncbi:MAG: hypothetical protein KGO49_06335 [Gammaproteobacteria bacterium]|nr:hypothetical protein [Gammaproteobacteria bacterium]
MKKIALITAITTPLFLSACGGGSGGDSSSSTTPTTTTPPAATTSTQQLTAQSINNFSIPVVGVRTSANVTTTATSGLPVTYTSTTPTICTVSGNTITGVSFGTCSITANQAGNTSFSAAQSVTQSVVVGAQTINLAIPPLVVGEVFPVTSTATSGFPITLTSQTPTVCTVSGMMLDVISTVPGSCIITATQGGNSQYSAASPVSLTIAVDAANQLVAYGATPVPSIFPESGSTKADSSTTFEGLYTTPTGVALIDSANNIAYYDVNSSLFGSLQITGSAWTLNSSSISYSNVLPSNRVSVPATGTGSFLLKQSFTANTQSFSTNPSPLSLTYGPANGYAVTQSSVAGNWIVNTGINQYKFSINNMGVITGTYTNTSGDLCAITGTLLLADPNTNHNLFNVSLAASSLPSSGATCNNDLSTLSGLSAMRFFAATTNGANGIFSAISMIAHASDGARMLITLYKQS